MVIKKGNSPKILRIKNVNFISIPKPYMHFPPWKLMSILSSTANFPERHNYRLLHCPFA